MSQVLVVIVIVWGALLDLVAKPWSSTDSVLERRRNDICTLLLWFVLSVLAAFTVRSGISTTSKDDRFTLQDWTAIILPFALAGPTIMETFTTLVRQVEMIRWIRRATVQSLPVAWMCRTMTIGESDDDGRWLRQFEWAPGTYDQRGDNLATSVSFWRCTSRHASLFVLFRRWLSVISSATRHRTVLCKNALHNRAFRQFIQDAIVLIFLATMTATIAVMVVLSVIEISLLLLFDYQWWLQRAAKRIIIARYDTMHFGREEMQAIFDQSALIRTSMRAGPGPSAGATRHGNDDGLGAGVEELTQFAFLHDRVMGSVLTTAAVFENAFRKAYLVTPVYTHSLTNRKVLRARYAELGCDLDMLIKSIRSLLERRHTAGLLSITPPTASIEAALHDCIEHVLSVSMYFPTGALYNVAARVAEIEAKVEERLRQAGLMNSEQAVRERVVYIDARNALFHILWMMAARLWTKRVDAWEQGFCEDYREAEDPTEDEEEESRTSDGDADSAERGMAIPTNDAPCSNIAHGKFGWGNLTSAQVDTLYIIATFLSRCRYCHRYSFDYDSEFYEEVRTLCEQQGKESVYAEFSRLSEDALKHRSFSLLDWTAREYSLRWEPAQFEGRPMKCRWTDDDGIEKEAECDIFL